MPAVCFLQAEGENSRRNMVKCCCIDRGENAILTLVIISVKECVSVQEAKRFPTAMFGFERKAVLDYIYEQDRQAREALEELAVRNDTLDRKAAELNEKLETLTAQYKQAVSDSEEKQRRMTEQGADCARLRERTNKLAAQLLDKENALQLQMELNKKMQAKVNEQEAALNDLRADLNEAKLQADLFKGRHEDFNGLKNQLDEIRVQFAERLDQFEKDFNRLEAEVPCCRAVARCGKTEKPAEEKPKVHKVTLRRRGTVQQPVEPEKSTGGAGSRVCKILNEWK